MKYEKNIEKIKRFIKEKTNSLEGGIIGLSGGIDSALVAYLSVGAIGKEKVYGLMMPYGKQSTEDAETVAKSLGIRYDIIDIKPMVDTFEKTAPYFVKALPKGNLMARVRMCLLYGAANDRNLIVLGTTNKSEMELGYFTKHGDGAVDIEPIVHLYKVQVWEMAQDLGVPKQVIDKKPSANLWEGQTDEGEFGFSYKTLDRYLQGDKKGISEATIKEIERRRKASEHKKKMPACLEEGI